MHDQYGIEVVADWSNFAYKMVTLLLGHIGMLIALLKKSWIAKSETPNSRLTIQNSAFGVVLDCSISR